VHICMFVNKMIDAGIDSHYSSDVFGNLHDWHYRE
jgi:hypothetical protein